MVAGPTYRDMLKAVEVKDADDRIQPLGPIMLMPQDANIDQQSANNATGESQPQPKGTSEGL